MSISFSCSNVSCGRKMRASDDAVGKKVRCPACGTIQAIPVMKAPVAAEQNVIQSQGDPASIVCPNCKACLAPSSILCVTCGFDFRKGKLLVKPSKPANRKSSGPSFPTWALVGGGGIGALTIIVLLLLALWPSSEPQPSSVAAQRSPGGTVQQPPKLGGEPNYSGSEILPASTGKQSSNAQETVVRSNPLQSLKKIGLALHNYAQAHRTFPPAYSVDEDGKPLLSWRVLILPYLMNGEYLYKQFHLNEPWDSEHNKTLIARMPPVYSNPDSTLASEGKTNYLTFRGEKTLYPGNKGVDFASITDGLSNTLMTIEVSDAKAVIWSKPDDLEIESVDSAEGLSALRPAGFYVGFADGHVEFLKSSITLSDLIALSSRNGGELVSLDKWRTKGPYVQKRFSVSVPAIDAVAAGARAIELFDTNKDGKIDGAELDGCPGLKAAIDQIDPSGMREITADKIAARIKAWQDSKLARMTISCTVLHNGQPLEGTEVRFVPEKYLGDNIPVATGKTDQNGVAFLSIPTTGQTDPPGVPCGFYRVEISKPGVNIPAKFNTNTILGQEVALNAAGIMEGIKFNLEY